MRKRIFIGLIAVTAIGGAALLLSQPKPGTVEWHKREYRAAQREWNQRRMVFASVRQQFRCLLGLKNLGDPTIRRDIHIKALLRFGYLEKREFRLQDLPRHESYRALVGLAAEELPRNRVWRITYDTETYTYTALVVEAEPRDRAKWQEMVRKVYEP